MTVEKHVLDTDPPQLKAAFVYLDQKVRERPGKDAHPVITAAYTAAGFPSIKDDTTAWCGGFQALCALDAGLPIPVVNPLGGINWENHGLSIYHKKTGKGRMTDAQRGDWVTLFYEGEDTWKRHVCQFLGFEGNKVVVIGGNQKNAVTIASYPIANISAIRRPVPATKKDLKDAGSTEMAEADALIKSGIVTTGAGIVSGGAQAYVEAPVIPPPKSLTEIAGDLSATDMILNTASSLGSFFWRHPILCVVILTGLYCWHKGYRLSNSRLVRHLLGYPISTQIVPAEAPVDPVAAAG